jgi:cysteinyl-tRNA synthetase
MAKSSNNFHTLRDVVDKGFDPLALRLLYLQAHYRTQMNFTWESLEAAHNHLKSLQAWADMRHQPSAETMPSELDELFDKTRADILRALQDDLSTPQAIAALDRLVNYMSHIQIPGIDGKHSDGTLAFLDAVFGLNLNNRPDITEAQKDLIKKREEARKKQAWEESDKIRNELESQGIELNDMPHHSYWSRA